MSKSPDKKPEGGTGRVQPRRGHGHHHPVLQERDEEMLRWITRHGAVTAELVGRRFFWRPKEAKYGKWAAYRRLRALQDLGLILSDKPFADIPAVIRVTREGARIADVGLRPAPLVPSQLRHTIAVVWLTENLLFEHQGAELVTEREIRAERYRELREGEREPGYGRTPDALLRIPTKGPGAQGIETVAIELDLSRKDRRAIERVIYQYDRERVDKVWWYVAQESPGHVRGEKRVERVAEVVRHLRADNRIDVRPWPSS